VSHEITDTNSKFPNQDIPDGTRTFTVMEVTKKYGKNGGEFFVWKLSYEGGVGEQVMLPNMMGELLRVLKCEETEKNKFDWDTMEQVDKTFSATVSHKPDVKDSKIIRQHMSGFLPF
jgi:hypothetical protein